MIRSIQFSIILAATIGQLTAAPYGSGGLATQWKQPGGSTVALKVFGNEYYGRTENSAGYTVVINEKDATYYYAKLSSDGSALVPTSTKADGAPPAGLAKHLQLPQSAVSAIVRTNRAKEGSGLKERWDARVKAVQKVRSASTGAVIPADEVSEAKVMAAPLTGNKKGLTILVRFPDVKFPTTQEKIESYCNGVGYTENGNTGSVRDYFFDQSNGKLTYTQKVTKIVTMPKPRDFYNFSDYPTNRTLFGAGDSGRLLLNHAITALKAQSFDFSGLSTEAGGIAIATNIFFAGDDSGAWAQGLWPHQSSLRQPVSVGTPSNPLYLYNYQITNLANAAPVIGTFCHENGHLILGYPDLYDYDYDSQGVGYHCLMAAGSDTDGGRTPSPINAYFKDIAGWATVEDVSPAEFKTVTLATTGNKFFRFRKPNSTTEYFIVENRGAGDKWAKFVPDKGIAIWHIDELVDGNNFQDGNAARHYQVSLEQADGRFDMERNINPGDQSDLFKLGAKFGDTTPANAKWWDNTNSSVKIEVLSSIAQKTSVLFGAVPPNTIILGSPNGGEVLYPSTTYVINWKANISGRVKIELLKGGVVQSVVAASEDNDGVYKWSIPASLVPAKDYSLRMSSITNRVPTTDSSDNLFSVSATTFPAGNSMPYGWFKPNSARTAWVIGKSAVYEGKASLETKTVEDGQMAAIAYKSDFLDGSVSFYVKVSTEGSFDNARFYIDGVPQPFASQANKTGLSGNVDWTFVSIPVSAGKHTFMWTYEKDDSYPGRQDKVWLDAISLPPTTQEIAIEDPSGADLKSGQGILTLPDTGIGSKSSAQTFTILNKGKADLSGLKISLSGANASEFTVRELKKTAIGPNTRTTFEVLFSPKTTGAKAATVIVRSNDEDESRFAINVQGLALGVSKIDVRLASGTSVKKGSDIKFGPAKVGSSLLTRTFFITNTGVSNLNRLGVTKTGANAKNFGISGASALTSLAPGQSASLTVTFKPSAVGKRTASISITSNDQKTGTFVINLSGTGTAKKSGTKKAMAAGSIADLALGKSKASSLLAVPSIEVVEGSKYRSLTITKQDGVAPGTVEVSPNLLDWYSGKKHTTVVVDNATTLKVRDNTPVTPDSKRFIRVK